MVPATTLEKAEAVRRMMDARGTVKLKERQYMGLGDVCLVFFKCGSMSLNERAS
jgi:hypothetical protein